MQNGRIFTKKACLRRAEAPIWKNKHQKCQHNLARTVNGMVGVENAFRGFRFGNGQIGEQTKVAPRKRPRPIKLHTFSASPSHQKILDAGHCSCPSSGR